VCFDVGLNTLVAAISDRPLADVAEIGGTFRDGAKGGFRQFGVAAIERPQSVPPAYIIVDCLGNDGLPARRAAAAIPDHREVPLSTIVELTRS
jgi:hypothetical protein